MRELDTVFPAVGAIGPTADSLDTPFWEGLRTGELVVQHCPGCGRWLWAPQWRCGDCGNYDLTWRPVLASGRIFSWVRTWHAFSPVFADHLPYVTALVELPAAGGIRLLGILHVEAGREVRIGDAVVGAVQRASDATSGWPVLRWLPDDLGSSA